MRAFRLIAICVASVMSFSAMASKPDWQGKQYGYFASGETMQKILIEFAASYGIPAKVSEKLTVPVNGKFESQSADSFLKQLSSVSSMEWYYDGHMLYFYSPDESQNAVIRLKNLDTDKFYQTISVLPWWQINSHWTAMKDQKLIFVAGAAQFVERVQEVAALLDNEVRKERDEKFTISTYRLKYASATDYEYSYRGQTKVIPGIASILSNTLNVAPTFFNASFAGEELTGVMKTRQNTKQAQEKANNTSQEPATIKQMPRQQGISPFIKADHRLNALVIGDTQVNQDIYANLIQSLDQPLDQVEINVTIANISTDDLSELGVDWQYTSSDVNMGFGTTGTALDAASGELQLLAGSATSFLSKIRVLATEGKASIMAQPAVLTLDNFEAVLDNSSTFYVRLQGQEEVDLYPVTVGTLLRVTPHIQPMLNGNQIRMDIQIEDGQQSSTQTVDSIPVVSKTVINTQSLVKEGQSLLIGGYYYDSDTVTESKVPVLSQIPILGNLFKSTKKEKARMVRLFLISPRIITDQEVYTVPSGLNTDANLQLFKVER